MLSLSFAKDFKMPSAGKRYGHIEKRHYRLHEGFIIAVAAKVRYLEDLNLYTAIWNVLMAQDTKSQWREAGNGPDLLKAGPTPVSYLI